MLEWIIFAFIGVVTGLFSGLLGLGGGLVIVPALLAVFSWQALPATQPIHVAIATSLMTITITSLSSMYAHHQHKNINWLVVKRLMPGLMLGGLFGAFVATMLSGALLQKCFAIYVVLVAIRMWLPMSSVVDERLLKQSILLGVGSIIGSISAVVGIGGGSLVVPYLVMAKQTIHRAIGTSAACGFPVSVAAVFGYLIFGQVQMETNGSWSTGIIHWQAFIGIISTSILFVGIGAKLVKRLPVMLLKRLFSLVLLLIGIFLFS